MNGAEAIVFWLGGFSSDPEYPLSGAGGPSFVPAAEQEQLEGRSFRYEFALDRLGPRNSDGQFYPVDDGGQGRYVLYTDPQNNSITRRINFWRYTAPGSEQPFAYFDTSRYRAQVETAAGSGVYTVDYDPWFGKLDATTALYAIKTPNSTIPDRYEFANEGKFQILHCGLDDIWGDFSVFQLIGSDPPLCTTPMARSWATWRTR